MEAAQQDQLSPQDLAALQEVHLHLQVANDPRADRVGKYLTSIGAPPQKLNPDQPAMQSAVDPLAPRPVGEKAEETIHHYVDSAKSALEAPFNAGVQLVHDLKTGESHGPHNIEKYGVLQGTVKTIVDSFKKLNPVAPDTGQGPLNRVADTAGGLSGAALMGEAAPGAEDVNALKEAPGKLMAASKAAIEKGGSAVKVIGSMAPDAIGLISPRAPHAAALVRKSADLFGKIRDVVKPAEAPAEAPDTSVPVSSVSMTQFPPKLAADSAAKVNASVPSSTTQIPAPLAAKVNTVLDNAQAQVKKVIADTERTYPKKGTFADIMDDAAASQEANWDLEKQMYRGLSEERQKFFADNAPTFTKGQLVAREQVGQILNEASQKAAKILDEANLPSETRKKLISSISAPAEPTPPIKPAPAAPAAAKPVPAEYQDMTEILRRSKEAVERSRKGK